MSSEGRGTDDVLRPAGAKALMFVRSRVRQRLIQTLAGQTSGRFAVFFRARQHFPVLLLLLRSLRCHPEVCPPRTLTLASLLLFSLLLLLLLWPRIAEGSYFGAAGACAMCICLMRRHGPFGFILSCFYWSDRSFLHPLPSPRAVQAVGVENKKPSYRGMVIFH